jgi:hypothetical protein
MTSRSFVLALAFCAALPAAADRNFGVKAGVLNIDGDSAAATQAGIVYTADIWGMFGIEFDATTSIAKGEVTPLEYGVTQFGAYDEQRPRLRRRLRLRVLRCCDGGRVRAVQGRRQRRRDGDALHQVLI